MIILPTVQHTACFNDTLFTPTDEATVFASFAFLAKEFALWNFFQSQTTQMKSARTVSFTEKQFTRCLACFAHELLLSCSASGYLFILLVHMTFSIRLFQRLKITTLTTLIVIVDGEKNLHDKTPFQSCTGTKITKTSIPLLSLNLFPLKNKHTRQIAGK